MISRGLFQPQPFCDLTEQCGRDNKNVRTCNNVLLPLSWGETVEGERKRSLKKKSKKFKHSKELLLP